jgi:UDP-N-acetylmuramate dehydrogenase
MAIREKVSIRNYTTFRVNSTAEYFSAFSSVDELAALTSTRDPLMVLGGGSNVLFTKDFAGLLLKNEIMGIDILQETEDHVVVRAGAGEEWHNFVLYCIERGFGGVENLSLIPGSVGAAPIQNIGAYGVELKDVFWSLEAFNIHDKTIRQFSALDCEFGYRDSIFKRRYRNQFIITSVYFRLTKRPVFHTSYGAIQEELKKMNVTELSLRAISDAVINIRRSKLPDPAEIGNAGSFFKNPTISQSQFESLKAQFPGIVGYANPDGSIKLAAGWLIEHTGPDANRSWKGYREGDAGCHARQALVLVNYGNATGAQIFELSERILKSVKAKFNVDLEREVNII